MSQYQYSIGSVGINITGLGWYWYPLTNIEWYLHQYSRGKSESMNPLSPKVLILVSIGEGVLISIPILMRLFNQDVYKIEVGEVKC